MSPAGSHLEFSSGPKSNYTAMIIHDNFQFYPPVVSEKKIFKNFSQSEDIMSHGSHVGWLIGTKVTPLGQTMQRNMPAKFGPICFADSLKED